MTRIFGEILTGNDGKKYRVTEQYVFGPNNAPVHGAYFVEEVTEKSEALKWLDAHYPERAPELPPAINHCRRAAANALDKFIEVAKDLEQTQYRNYRVADFVENLKKWAGVK